MAPPLGVAFAHAPETIVFAIDTVVDTGDEPARSASRLEAVKHAVAAFVAAKLRVCPAHRFALATLSQRGAALLPFSPTSSADELLGHLRAVAAAEADAEPGEPLDLAALVAAVAPLRRQLATPPPAWRGAAPAPMPLRRLAHALLVPAGAGPAQQQARAAAPAAAPLLRVVLLYGRSCLPAPVLRGDVGDGVALDCLYLHAKPAPGVNQPQEVYEALEAAVERLAAAAGHASHIYEASAGASRKMLSCMGMLLAHPLQRRPQAETPPPLDIAAAPLMPLPSDAANAASGVPIVAKLPAAPGAWAKPLVVAAGRDAGDGGTEPAAPASSAWGGAAGAVGGSSAVGGAAPRAVPAASTAPWADPWDDAPAAGAAGAGGGIVTGVPLPANVAPGVPSRGASIDLPVGDLGEGVALGLAVPGSRSSGEGGPAGPTASGAAAALQQLELRELAAEVGPRGEALEGLADALATAGPGAHDGGSSAPPGGE
ncbi:hypothetical protein HT031_001357 [Scenedesmus sp. PABB004]|nr:hypothetical protein HT031_001357 [Scenedesmus sp. PABB004]